MMCFIEWLKKSEENKLKTKCALCKAKVEKSEVAIDLLATNLIGELNVNCPNKGTGCAWKGFLSDAPGHLKNDCRFKEGTELLPQWMKESKKRSKS